MKLLLPLTAALFIVSCKSETPVPDEPAPKTEAEIKAIRAEQLKLLNRKVALEKQLNRLVTNSEVDPSGQMKPIFEERQQALIDLQTIRSTHPNLQKLNKELDLWRGRIRSARSNKRDLEITQANEEISKVASKIHNLSKELPAIREAEDRIARSEKEIESVRRSLAEKTPEGQALVEELLEIEKTLSDTQ